jgi:hypothetical protein
MRYSFGLFLLVAGSCSPIYFPNSHNVPTFSKGGEFQGNMQAQLSTPFSSGVQAQAAYSLNDHIAVIGNYGYFQARAGGRSNLGEVGVGYFTNPSAKQYTSIFAGYGVSESDLHINNNFHGPAYQDSVLTKHNARQLLSRYSKFFVQPAYGLLFSNRVHLIFSLKASRIDFDNIYSNDKDRLRTPYGPTYHFEPAATLKLNFPNVNLGLLLQWGVHLTGDKQIQDSNIARFAFGLQLRLTPKKKE